MKCLRCGYYDWIIVIKDPNKPLSKTNWLEVNALEDKLCPHLRGNKPGEYKCAIHNYKRYKRTPCDRHGQLERSEKDLCRMGDYIINKLNRTSGKS